MKEEKEITILNRLVSCPRVTVGQVALEECKTCKYHKGIELVKENFKGFRIDDILCSLPVRIRIGYHVKGVV